MSVTTSRPAEPATVPAHPQPARYRLWLHALAILLLLGTFALVAVGGNVTSHGAGLAVPDWPGTFGYNMFLAPAEVWFRDPESGQFFHGQFWEHSHRLIGAAVGLLTIGLALGLWLTQRRRPWLAWLGVVLLGSVIVQGLMGGFRVTEVSTWLAGIHGVFGQLIFAAIVLVVAAVGRVWLDGVGGGEWAAARPRVDTVLFAVLLAIPAVALGASIIVGRDPNPDLTTWRFSTVGIIWVVAMSLFGLVAVGRLVQAVVQAWRAARPRWSMPQVATAALLATLVIQLVLGAAVRHSGASRSIPDAPLVFGGVTPPMTEAGLDRVVARLPEQLQNRLPIEHTLGDVWLHYTHRVWAVVVTAAVIWAVAAVFRTRRHDMALLFPPALLVVAFTFFQLMLGVMTVWSGVYPTMATFHQAAGAALLGLVMWLAIRTHLADEQMAPAAGVRNDYNPRPAAAVAVLQGKPA